MSTTDQQTVSSTARACDISGSGAEARFSQILCHLQELGVNTTDVAPAEMSQISFVADVLEGEAAVVVMTAVQGDVNGEGSSTGGVKTQTDDTGDGDVQTAQQTGIRSLMHNRTEITREATRLMQEATRLLLIQAATLVLQAKRLGERIKHDPKTAAKQVLEVVKQEVLQHPYRTAWTFGNLLLMPVFGAGWMCKLALRVLGFGALGPVAGSIATWYQSTWLGAYIPVGSFFSMLQRWGMTL